MIYPILLCGGHGTRLWPLSSTKKPKQFLHIGNQPSMFENSLKRLDELKFKRSIIVGNVEHKHILLKQIANVGTKAKIDILLEPQRQDTMAALLLAANHILKINSDATMLVMPSDHHINPVELFELDLEQATSIIEEKKAKMVPFGVKLEKLSRHFGYYKAIEPTQKNKTNPEFNVETFIEKPSKVQLAMLEEFQDILANSGIFMIKAEFLKELAEAYAALLSELVAKTHQTIKMQTEGVHEQIKLAYFDARYYEAITPISFDHAILENMSANNWAKVKLLRLHCEWMDLGSFSSLDQFFQHKSDHKKELNANPKLQPFDKQAAIKKKPSLDFESSQIMALSSSNNVKQEAINPTIIQEIKASIKHLREVPKGACDKSNYSSKVQKPWGYYKILQVNPFYKTKLLMIKPGQKLSLQRHLHRSEHWVVVEGTALVTIDNRSNYLFEDQSCYIPATKTHRLENPGKINLKIIEVQIGQYLEEDDIDRYSDCYGRKTLSNKI